MPPNQVENWAALQGLHAQVCVMVVTAEFVSYGKLPDPLMRKATLAFNAWPPGGDWVAMERSSGNLADKPTVQDLVVYGMQKENYAAFKED